MVWNEEVRVQNQRHLIRKSKLISPGDDVKSGLRSLVCYQTAVMSGILGVVTDVDYIMQIWQIPCYFISAPVDIPVALKVSTSKAANKNRRPRNLKAIRHASRLSPHAVISVDVEVKVEKGFWFVLGDLYVGSHLFLLEILLSNKADDDEIN